jgi:hypothetical protein
MCLTDPACGAGARPDGSLGGIIAQLKYPLPGGDPGLSSWSFCSRSLWIAGVTEPELPDRLGGVDLSRRSAEKEAQQQPEMRAGPGVTGPA